MRAGGWCAPAAPAGDHTFQATPRTALAHHTTDVCASFQRPPPTHTRLLMVHLPVEEAATGIGKRGEPRSCGRRRQLPQVSPSWPPRRRALSGLRPTPFPSAHLALFSLSCHSFPPSPNLSPPPPPHTPPPHCALRPHHGPRSISRLLSIRLLSRPPRRPWLNRTRAPCRHRIGKRKAAQRSRAS